MIFNFKSNAVLPLYGVPVGPGLVGEGWSGCLGAGAALVGAVGGELPTPAARCRPAVTSRGPVLVVEGGLPQLDLAGMVNIKFQSESPSF